MRQRVLLPSDPTASCQSVSCSIRLYNETVRLEGLVAARPSVRKHKSGQGKCFGEKSNRHSELEGLLSGVSLRGLLLLFGAGSQRSDGGGVFVSVLLWLLHPTLLKF